MHIEMKEGRLEASYALGKLSQDGAGAMVLFSGVVRPEENGSRIDKLHYDHYPEMAERVLKAIVQDVMDKHKLKDVVVIHRVGDVPAGEASIFIAVSSERRKDSFAGCSEMIDRIKTEAPIWKKDIGERTQWQSERS